MKNRVRFVVVVDDDDDDDDNGDASKYFRTIEY